MSLACEFMLEIEHGATKTIKKAVEWDELRQIYLDPWIDHQRVIGYRVDNGKDAWIMFHSREGS